MTITLSQLKAVLEQNDQLIDITQESKVMLNALTYYSKEAKKGTLFFCKGAHFKQRYLDEAIRNGASAYVSEHLYDVNVPGIIVKDIRKVMPIVANKFYQEPWRSFQLIGITGTKGKTTTADYLRSIFDADLIRQGKQQKSAFLSSLRVYDGVVDDEAHLTTPESLELFQHFKHVEDQRIPYLTMEVSSQALKYDRVDEVYFDVVAFLNISEDHISPVEHPTFEDYFNSKLKIFNQGRVAVINLDSQHLDRIMCAAKESSTVEKIITVSCSDPSADYYAYDMTMSQTEQTFMLQSSDYSQRFSMKMLGRFNIQNALVAIAIARYYKIPYHSIKVALSGVSTKGRMLIDQTKDGKIHSIVDFAHNKLSFEKLFETVKELFPRSKITIVFGSPGNKAVSRRHDLGKVAAKYADTIIITTDDPGNESPQKISEEILNVIEGRQKTAQIILDRGEAIHHAFEQANHSEGDVILIAGKGNENTMKVNGESLPYLTDSYYVKKAIRSYNNRKQ